MNNNETPLDEETLQNALIDMMTQGYDDSDVCWESLRIRSYKQAGVMTTDKGVVVGLPGGTEYQITIVRSR